MELFGNVWRRKLHNYFLSASGFILGIFQTSKFIVAILLSAIKDVRQNQAGEACLIEKDWNEDTFRDGAGDERNGTQL